MRQVAPSVGLDPAEATGELVPWWVDDAPHGRAMRPGLFVLLLALGPALWSLSCIG